MNSRYIGAARACNAPRAEPRLVKGALQKACAPADRSLRLRLFTTEEIFLIITKRIPGKLSKDAYGISMNTLRMIAGSIAPILCNLFNRYLRDGTCLDALKLSKISPIYKGKGKRQDIDSYRPVLIIPAIAKVLDNGISSRLVTFLADAQALSDRKYAYRVGQSTTSLAREMMRRVVEAREGKQQVAVLCCDLSKAFDVADHGILTLKLNHYGIRGKSLALLTELMNERSQIVVGEGGQLRSDTMTATMGVAQGSAVSNNLFSLLLNDLPCVITEAEVLMYADDVAAVFTAPSLQKLEANLNAVASQLAKWFRENGLVLNLTKTHFLLFDLSGRPRKVLNVYAEGTKIEQCDQTTFLGFEVDSRLYWEAHIDKVCGKLSGACFALRRLSRWCVLANMPQYTLCCSTGLKHHVQADVGQGVGSLSLAPSCTL